MAWCAQGSSEAAQQDRVLLSAADSLERLVREVRRGAAALQACELRCEQAAAAGGAGAGAAFAGPASLSVQPSEDVVTELAGEASAGAA